MVFYIVPFLFLTLYYPLLPFASPIVTGDSFQFNTSSPAEVLEERDTAGWKPDYVLHVTAEPITLSCRERVSVLINGQHPGPLLRFKEKEPKWVRVYNHLSGSDDVGITEVAMHWHGIDVLNHHDGTPETQKVISPGFFRDYKITPPAGSAGSYLYHDHAMSMSASTATGPIIVDPADGTRVPFQYDDERIIFISDIMLDPDREIEEYITGEKFVWPGEARSILVNGKGYGSWYPNMGEDEEMHQDDMDDLNPPAEAQTCQIEIIRVKAGKNYRFRFISGTAMTFNTFAMHYNKDKISHPPMQVIEADGEYTKPYATDRIHIGSGQRYSVLMPSVTLDSYRQAVKAGKIPGYWIEGRETGRPNENRGPVLIWVQLEDPDGPDTMSHMPLNGLKRNFEGNLKSDEDDGSFVSDTGISFQGRIDADLPLQPLTPYTNFPSKVSATIKITNKDIEIKNDKGTKVRWVMNDLSYTGPKNGVPRLLAMEKESKDYCPNPAAYSSPSRFDSSEKIYTLKKGDVVDVILENGAILSNSQNIDMYEGSESEAECDPMDLDPVDYVGGQPEYFVSDGHPFHMHGAHYYDLGAGSGAYSEDKVKKNIQNGHVLKRDTSMLYKYRIADETDNTKPFVDGWRAMRMEVDSLGVWLFHCHTLQHMLMGMSTLWAFGETEDIKNLPDPELDGWDVLTPRNVFSVKDKKANAGTKVPIEDFSQLNTAGENLGEKTSQGQFGVKAG